MAIPRTGAITTYKTQNFTPGTAPLPITEKQRAIQDQIRELNAANYDVHIRPRFGDLKPAHVLEFQDTAWGGNFDHARKHWNLGCEDRALYFFKARSFAICASVTLAALPAKIYYYVIHQLSDDRSLRMKDMRDRDVQDLIDAPLYLFLAAAYAISNAALALLMDGPTLLYRYIDQNYLKPGPRAAILLVDPQLTFFPAADLQIDGRWYHHSGGALSAALPTAWKTYPVMMRLLNAFLGKVYGCQDWHPLHHGATSKMLGVETYTPTTLNGVPQVAWPIHGVQGSKEAEYLPGLASRCEEIFKKGKDPLVDSYSAFKDANNETSTLLLERLWQNGITHLIIGGVAFDYCVGYSALHAAQAGLRTFVVEDATVGTVDQHNQPNASNAQRRGEMLLANVNFVSSKDVLSGRNRELAPFFNIVPDEAQEEQEEHENVPLMLLTALTTILALRDNGGGANRIQIFGNFNPRARALNPFALVAPAPQEVEHEPEPATPVQESTPDTVTES